MSDSTARQRDFHITVLGWTLEHLGSQMYKRRDVALAELVANCWDAGATEVELTVPGGSGYKAAASVIVVTDNGRGMNEDEVDENYLVIGRNRRAAGQPDPQGRKVMGRKGVGKLAGFGLARCLRVTTWREGLASSLILDADNLRTGVNQTKDITVAGEVRPIDSDSRHQTGTTIEMSELKHKTPVNVQGLRNALSRRFSRTVRGVMAIKVNGEPLTEPQLDLHFREPADGDVATHDLGDGRIVSYWTGFSKTVLPRELQGFTVLVRGKTAQAPPYFFEVEATASGLLNSTRWRAPQSFKRVLRHECG